MLEKNNSLLFPVQEFTRIKQLRVKMKSRNRDKHRIERKTLQNISREQDEEPQNEPGTSSTSQTSALHLHQKRAASHFSKQQPITWGTSCKCADSGDEDIECSDEYSAKSENSGKTVLKDFNVLTNDEHWAMTPETHKHASGKMENNNKTTRLHRVHNIHRTSMR